MRYFILILFLLPSCSSIHDCNWFDNYKNNIKGKAKLAKNISNKEINAQVKCKF